MKITLGRLKKLVAEGLSTDLKRGDQLHFDDSYPEEISKVYDLENLPADLPLNFDYKDIFGQPGVYVTTQSGASFAFREGALVNVGPGEWATPEAVEKLKAKEARQKAARKAFGPILDFLTNETTYRIDIDDIRNFRIKPTKSGIHFVFAIEGTNLMNATINAKDIEKELKMSSAELAQWMVDNGAKKLIVKRSRRTPPMYD